MLISILHEGEMADRPYIAVNKAAFLEYLRLFAIIDLKLREQDFILVRC